MMSLFSRTLLILRCAHCASSSGLGRADFAHVASRDAKPIILPGGDEGVGERKQIDGPTAKVKKATPDGGKAPAVRTLGGPRLVAPTATPAPAGSPVKTARVKAPKRNVKNDPKLVAAARELRDRWLERVNAGEYVFGDAG